MRPFAPFQRSLFISWLYSGTWEVIWCFFFFFYWNHELLPALLQVTSNFATWCGLGLPFGLLGLDFLVQIIPRAGNSMCGWRSVKNAKKGTQPSWGPQTWTTLRIRRLFYTLVIRMVYFSSSSSSRSSGIQRKVLQGDMTLGALLPVFSKLCNHCRHFKLSNSSEFVRWLLMKKV